MKWQVSGVAEKYVSTATSHSRIYTAPLFSPGICNHGDRKDQFADESPERQSVLPEPPSLLQADLGPDLNSVLCFSVSHKDGVIRFGI